MEILEEMGEETEGVIESTSKLQAKIKALSGVDILTDAGAYKDTYTILKEIGNVWEDMSDIDQAALLELMAGKNRANTLSAILSNMTDLEGAYESALKAEGSALKENEAYLDSIQGRIDLFNNSVQTMWMNAINSEVVKDFVSFGTTLIDFIDKLGLIQSLLTGIFTYVTTFSKLKLDFASILGIHRLDESFLKGFSAFGHQGFTGKIANLFKAKGKNNIADAILGDPSDIKVSVEDFADAIRDNIDDYVTIDTSRIDSEIQNVQNKLTIARKQLDEARKADWNYYQSLGSKTPAKDRDNRIAEQRQQIETLETDLTSLQAKRDDMISSAVTSTASSMVGAINNETQAYKSMLSVLDQVKDTKLYLGNEQDAVIKIDAMSAAAKNGQVDLANYISTLGDADVALKAYAASVKDGNYSLAGFQEFIKQHNANINASGIAAKAAAVGHQLLNAAISMGISMLISYGISLVMELANANEKVAETAREAAEASKELREQVDSLDDYKEQIMELRKELDKGNLSEQDAYDAREKLLTIQNDLIEKFGLEKDGINLVTGAINDQIAAIDKLSQKKAQQWINDNQKSINQAIKFFDSDIKGGQLDGFWEAYATGITNWAPTQNVRSMIDEYAKNNNNISTLNPVLTGAQEISFNGSVEEVKAQVEDFQNWLGDKQTEMQAKLSSLTSLPESEQTNDVKNEIKSLTKDIEQLQDVREDMGVEYQNWFGEGSTYAANKAVIEQTQYNTALTQYADQYTKILQAQNDLEEAQLRGDKEGISAALATLNAETDAAAKTAETNGQSYMISFFNGIKDGYAKLSNELQLETDLADTAKDVKNRLTEALSGLDGMNAQEILQLGEIDPNNTYFVTLTQLATEYGMSIEDLMNSLIKFGYIQSGFAEEAENVVRVSKTYSALTEHVTQYNEMLSQTSEIVADNTQVTQEYKDSILALGISEEELNECFDKNNKLVVKDARALNNLVKSAKKNTAQNIKLAKSQARLEYYELYKEMKELTNGTEVVDGATLDYINSLYRQMTALQRTIAKYSLLEAELLGAANAYQELADAQAADEAMDYGGKAEELVNVLAEAFNTAQLGTEAARVAIEGLIPDDVIDKSKTLDEQMQQVYDYFTKGEVSQLFTIEFDDEGAIQSIEMTKENVEAFTENLIGTDSDSVFQGSWDEFTLNPAIKTLEDFAEACGITEEVAFAFLTELEKYDIGNALGAGGDTLLDQLMGDDLDYQLQKAIQTAAEVEKKLAEGTLKATSNEYIEAQKQLEELEEKTIEDVTAWSKKQQALEEQKDLLKEYQKEYDKAIKNQDTSKVEEFEGKIKDTSKEIDALIDDLRELDEPTEFVLEVAMSEAKENIAEFKEDINELVASGDEKAIKINSFVEKIDTTGLEDLESLGFVKGPDGIWRGTANIEGWSQLDPASKQKVLEYINMLESEHQIDVLMGEGAVSVEEQLDTIAKILEDIAKILDPTYTLSVETSEAEQKATTFKSIWDSIQSKAVTLTKNVVETVTSFFTRTPKEGDGTSVNGTAHLSGTANAGGSWGAPKTETSLVGELGPELLVRGNRWTTVGENGAEFTQVKRGDIIFNHKQTEELLKNGYVTGRGKAYAGGTSYAFSSTAQRLNSDYFKTNTGPKIDTWDNAYKTVYNDYRNATIVEEGANVNTNDIDTNLKDDYGNTGDTDAEDIFEETFDWIEVRLEEINEDLNLKSAQLENAIGFSAQNAIIDEMISINENLRDNLLAGANKYYAHAETLLAKVPAEYRAAAQDGSIAIQDFIDAAGSDVNEEALNAIQEYREWVQKGADLNQQAEEVLAEIRNLAIQRVDNAYEHGNVRATVENSQTEKLQNAVDYDEARGLITDPNYYAAMMENSSKEIEYLTSARNAMQDEFDRAVQNGEITRGSNEWYETLDKLYQVDAEIDQATMELEEFQNAINDIYWDSFDETINHFDYLSEETQGLIDLMDSADMFSKPDDENGWGAGDVTWTAEGLATLGLHAQGMERAEEKAKMYAQAIDDLTADYEAGHYSESEYHEKLSELTQGQYDAIEAAQDEKDAIVELNEQRIDAIKEGIDKEIDAYSELIEKKKEELDAEKDLYDFQKSTMEQQKNISDIERQLAALANDNSMSAVAKRKQLEAELAEAKADLEDSYYNRSVDNQQEALDKELEGFQEEKEAEKEQLDQWLTNIEGVVAESLGIVKTNAAEIGKTLTDKASEYNLTVSDAVLNPWKDGMGAIDDYTTKIGDSVSPTTQALEPIREKWQQIKEELEAANKEADKYYDKSDATANGPSVADINAENAKYAEAKPKQEAPKPETPKQETPSLANGSSIVVKKSATHYGSKSGGAAMASFVPGGTYTVYQTSGDQVLIGLNGVYTGWIKKTDIEGFAKGTTGIKKDQLALIDELGDELIMHAGPNGKLQYLTKGTSVIPHDISENLMKLGQLDPSEVLSRSTPQIAPSKSIVNTEISIDCSVGTMVNIEHCDQNTLPDVEKIVNKAFDKHMQTLNNSIRKFAR